MWFQFSVIIKPFLLAIPTLRLKKNKMPIRYLDDGTAVGDTGPDGQTSTDNGLTAQNPRWA